MQKTATKNSIPTRTNSFYKTSPKIASSRHFVKVATLATCSKITQFRSQLLKAYNYANTGRTSAQLV